MSNLQSRPARAAIDSVPQEKPTKSGTALSEEQISDHSLVARGLACLCETRVLDSVAFKIVVAYGVAASVGSFWGDGVHDGPKLINRRNQ